MNHDEMLQLMDLVAPGSRRRNEDGSEVTTYISRRRKPQKKRK